MFRRLIALAPVALLLALGLNLSYAQRGPSQPQPSPAFDGRPVVDARERPPPRIERELDRLRAKDKAALAELWAELDRVQNPKLTPKDRNAALLEMLQRIRLQPKYIDALIERLERREREQNPRIEPTPRIQPRR